MNHSKFRKQKNPLQDFILRGTSKEYSKQTITGLFRSMLEPLTEMQNQEALVLIRVKDDENISSVIKRVGFTAAKMYFFSEQDVTADSSNIEKSDIFGQTEFLLVLAPRYTAVLLWDYSLSDVEDSSEICLIYNSRSVAEVAKAIFSNSKIDLEQYLTDFAPDRRENELLNVSINKIVDCLNNVNEEIVITEAEKDNLSKTEELLQEYEYTADKAKMIAHEIKNHLSIIDLYSKITEKRLPDVCADKAIMDSIQNAIKSIRYSTYSITQFVNELKTFAKPILVDKRLIPMIEDVISLTLPKAKEHCVSLNYFVDEDVRVHVDEIKIQSVLINLVYNAIEAISDGGSIDIKATLKTKTLASVVVNDNGSGISNDIKSKIFEEGFTTKLTGNGLGLHICKKLMKEQYGDINLLHSDKNGTSIEVLIPII